MMVLRHCLQANIISWVMSGQCTVKSAHCLVHEEPRKPVIAPVYTRDMVYFQFVLSILGDVDGLSKTAYPLL